MKKLSQQPEAMFYLATDRIMFHVKEPYRIQEEMIEMKNFVPEAFMIHQFQEYKDVEMECYDCIRLTKKEAVSPMLDSNVAQQQEPPLRMVDEDEDDDDWDEEDEDWDDEDEDWDEDDEEDEDWDDEDEDWDEDDEDWDDDVDEGGDEE